METFDMKIDYHIKQLWWETNSMFFISADSLYIPFSWIAPLRS